MVSHSYLIIMGVPREMRMEVEAYFQKHNQNSASFTPNPEQVFLNILLFSIKCFSMHGHVKFPYQ